jgi:hypothetical protein
MFTPHKRGREIRISGLRFMRRGLQLIELPFGVCFNFLSFTKSRFEKFDFLLKCVNEIVYRLMIMIFWLTGFW